MKINFIAERLKEPSSWRGLVMLLTGLGVNISPELSSQIVLSGIAVAGLIGVATKG